MTNFNPVTSSTVLMGMLLFLNPLQMKRKQKSLFSKREGHGSERSVYLISRLKEHGFKPLRYKPLDSRWTKQSLAPASYTAATVASSDHFNSSGKAASPLVEPVVARPMQRGDWARYRVGVGEESVRSVSGVDSEGHVDSRPGFEGWQDSMERGVCFLPDASFVENLDSLWRFH